MADFRRIAVLGINGEEMLRFLKLDDDQYYGGATSDGYIDRAIGAYGPHLLFTTAGMLDLIAALARVKQPHGLPLRLESGLNSHYAFENIGGRMRSDRLAEVLDVPEATVRDHYAHIVLIPEEDGSGSGS